MNDFIIRYSAPTKYDKEPIGTIYKIVKDDKSFDYYIQISHQEAEPKWESIGDFLTLAFKNSLHNKEFIANCLANCLNNVDA